MSGPQLDIDSIEADRLELIDTLAAGDGQDWPDFWQNAQQRQIAVTMYGKQADELLASSWLAKRDTESFSKGFEQVRRRCVVAEDALDAALGAAVTPTRQVEDAAILATFKAECDKVGVPYDPAGLVRHHKANAEIAAGAWKLTAEHLQGKLDNPARPVTPTPQDGKCAARWPQNEHIRCARLAGHDGRHCNAIKLSQYGDDFIGRCIWDDEPPVTSTPEAATRDEKLVQLKLTQMRAAVVQCCNAGREAYPDPCPWHGPKGQQS